MKGAGHINHKGVGHINHKGVGHINHGGTGHISHGGRREEGREREGMVEIGREERMGGIEGRTGRKEIVKEGRGREEGRGGGKGVVYMYTWHASPWFRKRSIGAIRFYGEGYWDRWIKGEGVGGRVQCIVSPGWSALLGSDHIDVRRQGMGGW